MTRFEAKFGEVIDNSTLHKQKHPTSLMKLLYKLRKLQSLAKDYRSSSRIRALSKALSFHQNNNNVRTIDTHKR